MTHFSLPWRVQPHDNYMPEGYGEPIEIVAADGQIVACNTAFYPTGITAGNAALIVAAVNSTAPTVAAQQCGLEAAKKDVGAKFHFMVERAIRAYLTYVTPPDVSGLVQRLEAFAAGCRGSMWQSCDETIRLCEEAATALRLSAGGGWRTMDSAPKDGSDIQIWTANAEQDVAWWDGHGWCCGKDADGGRSYYPGAELWRPSRLLPASPTVEAGR